MRKINSELWWDRLLQLRDKGQGWPQMSVARFPFSAVLQGTSQHAALKGARAFRSGTGIAMAMRK
jgi:hypothetical protein